MHVITARNVGQALPVGIALLQRRGLKEDSRNGPVLRYPTPVTTVLTHPMERVLFYPWRDANPFFHIVEAAWMLAGRNDLAALTPYVANMVNYSDDGGVTQPGAYGKRWRDHTLPDTIEGDASWGDQLDWAVKRLRASPNDRRVVIQMWDPNADMWAADYNGADVPCNLTMIPWVMNNQLHLTVFNRSHDIIWGLYGANAVHFSIVLEYLAGRLGLNVGSMTTISNNFHAYTATLPDVKNVERLLYSTEDPYENDVGPFSLLDADFTRYEEPEREAIMCEDLRVFFEHGAVTARGRWPWLHSVLVPMARAHSAWRLGRGPTRYTKALEILAYVQATDWRRAGTEWILRRQTKYARAADDGVSYDAQP